MRNSEIVLLLFSACGLFVSAALLFYGGYHLPLRSELDRTKNYFEEVQRGRQAFTEEKVVLFLEHYVEIQQAQQNTYASIKSFSHSLSLLLAFFGALITWVICSVVIRNKQQITKGSTGATKAGRCP